MTPTVQLLLLINGVVFLIQQYADPFLIRWFALWPLGSPGLVMTPQGFWRVPEFELWQLVSYGFLHGGLLHIFFNMFGLWMFGVPLEQLWGARRFLHYYFVCVVGAGLVQLLVSSLLVDRAGGFYPTVGASGGVLGVLMAFAMMYPNRLIMLVFPPIPMKAKWFVVFFAGFTLWAGITGTQAGVAHFAHLGGMLFGFLMIQYWRRRWPFGR
ncbi:MAG: rhomboid family intramembrane serine protease [Candidatus Competibacterales bacterium]|nr:rhomboid family intramembrane serine protease [Candidatus Competibacterales bacterium]